jgi:hypothetical protein
VLDNFPKDSVWCDTTSPPIFDAAGQAVRTVATDNSGKECLKSLKTKLKKLSHRLRTEKKIWKKIEALLQDQASKLDVEHVLLQGLPTSLPRQQWHDFLNEHDP